MFSKKWKTRFSILINLLVVLGLLVSCTTPVVTTSTAPAPMAAQPPVAVEATPATVNTPRPDFMPADAVLVPTPVAAPVPPESQIYRMPSGPTSEEIQNRLLTQGYVQCPEEEVLLLEDGIAYICPGAGADMPMMTAIFAPAGLFALADGPQPGLADAGGVVYIFISAALAATTGYALSQMPHILMARNPNLLPDVVVPNNIPAPPNHIVNHPRGEYTAKLKMLGWVSVMTSWLTATNGGPKPDWCGEREDGAILIVYYTAKIMTTTGRAYEGIAAIVNRGGAHLSTILTGVTPPSEPGGLPNSGNSSGNDFSQFTPLPPDQCPPMPQMVTQ